MTNLWSAISLELAELVCAVTALLCILLRRSGTEYRGLCTYLGFHTVQGVPFLAISLCSRYNSTWQAPYRFYYFSYWLGFAVESVLGLLLIHGLFHLTMAPLDGIRQLGRLVFRWAAVISLAVTLSLAILPKAGGTTFFTNFVVELQRTQGILTLCLLLFVCFAVRPLGLSYRSRIFGICLGLGLLSTANLASAAWLTHFGQMKTLINTVYSVVSCVALLLWAAYFALPERKRSIVVLPTTSPFLRWNQIAQALGAKPGFVAVSGVPPELFASAELDFMRRASTKMH